MIQVRGEHFAVSGVSTLDMREGLGQSVKRRFLQTEAPAAELHPAWKEFIRFCREMQYGEVERLSIQDGLPVLAEVTKKKVRFK
ncbi:MAG: hypothetical protein IT161_15480 [Bryobacterales bacterium]|nr:hypothetical protein [Bryobacterales bacterium]